MRSEESAIVIEDLAKRYFRRPVLSNVALVVRRGEIAGIRGRNAVGKSTLFAILGGFARPSAGKAEILGEPCGSRRLHGRVGIAPETVWLPPDERLTAFLERLARLQLSRRRAMDEIAAVVETLELQAWSKARLGTLSKGLAHRVVLAQALLGAPEVLLLDEPTNGLDAPLRARLTAELEARALAGAAILVSSHDDAWLEETCDLTFSLENGSLLQDDPIVAAPSSTKPSESGPSDSARIETAEESVAC